MTRNDGSKRQSSEQAQAIEQAKDAYAQWKVNANDVYARWKVIASAAAHLPSRLDQLGPTQVLEILSMLRPQATEPELATFVADFIAVWEKSSSGLTAIRIPRTLKGFLEWGVTFNKFEKLFAAQNQLGQTRADRQHDQPLASTDDDSVKPADTEKTMNLIVRFNLIKDRIRMIMVAAKEETEFTGELGLTSYEINYLKNHCIRFVESEQKIKLAFVPRGARQPQGPPSPVKELPSLNLLLSVALRANLDRLILDVKGWNRDYRQWETDRNLRQPQPPPLQPWIALPAPSGTVVEAPSAQYYAALQRAMVGIRHLEKWPYEPKEDPRDEWRFFTDSSGWIVRYGNPIKAEMLNPVFPKIAEMQMAAGHQAVSSKNQAVRQKARAFLIKQGNGELVMDLFDILFWHWIVQDKPDSFGITDGMLQAYRGQPAYTVEELQNQQAAMQQLQHFYFNHPKHTRHRIPKTLLTWFAHTDHSAVGAAPQLTYEVNIDPLLREEDKFSPGYTPRNGAFYDSRLWMLHPVRDLLVRRLLRSLRWEWRTHVGKYTGGGDSAFRTWRYHLEICGFDIAVLAERPGEFCDALNIAIWKMIKGEFLKGENKSNALTQAKYDWHPGLYRDCPPDAEDPCRKFAKFLEREVRLLPTDSVTQALTSRVAAQRAGRDSVRSKHKQAKKTAKAGQ